jgi:hypothetical protein
MLYITNGGNANPPLPQHSWDSPQLRAAARDSRSTSSSGRSQETITRLRILAELLVAGFNRCESDAGLRNQCARV